MAARANWKGHLKLGDVTCAIALYTGVSTNERIAFHMLNRRTGNRLHRLFVDSDTGKEVERDDQVKGYEVSSGDYVVLEPEEVAEAVPEGDKVLDIDAFIACDDIDDVYLDKPYYIAPTDKSAHEAFALLRDGMAKKKVAALAQTVLFRRVRTLLIRPHGKGLIGATLNYDYEVTPAEKAFDSVRDKKLDAEMVALAEHIIKTKRGKFNPADYDDRYEAALADLVKAKLAGREIKPPKPRREEKVVSLMDALRESAGKKTPAKPKTATKTAAAKPRTSKPAPRKKAS